MKNRFLANDTARLFGIGRFYEELTMHVVGGTRLADIHGIDLEHPDLDTMIEVKAMGSSQYPVLYTEQLENHLDQRGFPYTYCCYAIWMYKNTRQNRIGKCGFGTARQLCAKLAERTLGLYVLDARVLEGAMLRHGSVEFQRKGVPASRINIGTTWLRRFAAAPAATLWKLGLRPRTFYVQQARAQTVFEGLPVQFDYTAVLPRSAAGFVWPIHRRQKAHLAAVAASA